jgi:hypothetical protein
MLRGNVLSKTFEMEIGITNDELKKQYSKKNNF